MVKEIMRILAREAVEQLETGRPEAGECWQDVERQRWQRR